MKTQELFPFLFAALSCFFCVRYLEAAAAAAGDSQTQYIILVFSMNFAWLPYKILRCIRVEILFKSGRMRRAQSAYRVQTAWGQRIAEPPAQKISWAIRCGAAYSRDTRLIWALQRRLHAEFTSKNFLQLIDEETSLQIQPLHKFLCINVTLCISLINVYKPIQPETERGRFIFNKLGHRNRKSWGTNWILTCIFN